MIILDTDVLSIVQRGQGQEFDRLVARLAAFDEDQVAVTIITFEEQMRGWLAYIAQSKSDAGQLSGYARLHSLIEDYQLRPVLKYDGAAIGVFNNLKRNKIRVGTMDLKIAAIALSLKATLITRNLVDFSRIPGLKFDDWAT